MPDEGETMEDSKRDEIKAALLQAVEERKAERARNELISKLALLRSKGKLTRQVWSELTADREADEARRYDKAAALEALQLVEHPVFGLGVVVERTGEHKVCVLFEDRARLMLCGGAPDDPA